MPQNLEEKVNWEKQSAIWMYKWANVDLHLFCCPSFGCPSFHCPSVRCLVPYYGICFRSGSFNFLFFSCLCFVLCLYRNITNSCYLYFLCDAVCASGTYTVNRKKTWQYIWHHNSGQTRFIFIIFALLYAGRNVLHIHEKYVHLIWIMYIRYLVKVKHWHFTLIMHSYLRLSNYDVILTSHVK